MNESIYQRSLEDFEASWANMSFPPKKKTRCAQAIRVNSRQLGVHGMLCLYIKRLNPEFRDNIYWAQK